MTVSRYSIVRYVPDPLREERVNVGVALVAEDGSFARCRFLHNWSRVRGFGAEDISFLKEFAADLEREMARTADLFEPRGFEADCLGAYAANWANSIQLSEPRASVADDLDALLTRLVHQFLVEPTPGAPRHWPAALALEKRFRPWVDKHVIEPGHTFGDSRSGVPRVVSYFANSGANLALEALRLDLKRAESIQTRADAEARKIEDIRNRHAEIDMIVYCELPEDPALGQASRFARLTLEDVGAQVTSNLDEASDRMLAAVGAR